jgi:hypothetical protein
MNTMLELKSKTDLRATKQSGLKYRYHFATLTLQPNLTR